MPTKLGKMNFLAHFRVPNGSLTMSMVCTRAAYRRDDGTVYIVDGYGKRRTLTPCEPVADPTWPYSYELYTYAPAEEP